MTTRSDEALAQGTRGTRESRPGYRPWQSLTEARVSIMTGFGGLGSPAEIASRLDYVLPDLVQQINAELAEIRQKPSYITPKSVTVDEIAAGAITTTEISDNAISTPKLQAGAVTAAKIAADTITANEIAAGAITTDELAAASVTAAKISVSSLSAIAADMGTLTAGKIDVGSIEINADTERILFGAASAPLTGAGVFLGKDGADYEFRVGDPAGNYIHWNGSAFTISGALIATGNIQDGAVTFPKIDTTGADGSAEQILRYDTSSTKIIASSKVTITVTGSETILDVNAQISTLQLTASGANQARVVFKTNSGTNKSFRIFAQDTAVQDWIAIDETHVSGPTTYTHWQAANAGGASYAITYGDGSASNKATHSFNGPIVTSQFVSVIDGMTAPATASGQARIYVDSADGDLKVKFGDGTVKTIVTDT